MFTPVDATVPPHLSDFPPLQLTMICCSYITAVMLSNILILKY